MTRSTLVISQYDIRLTYDVRIWLLQEENICYICEFVSKN